MLDAIAPILRADPLSITATDTPGPVNSEQRFYPTIKNLPFAAWLQVDYLSGDGTVFHVTPMAAVKKIRLVTEPAQLYPAGYTLLLGRKPHNALVPNIPFGKDMFIAVASDEKLFTSLRPQSENIAQYGEALQEAIEKIRAKGGKVAAGVTLVKTEK